MPAKYLSQLATKQGIGNFCHPVIFLFFGGFALATALHIQKLDRKIAMWIISMSGGHLGISVLSIFAVTAALSMWISNTAHCSDDVTTGTGLVVTPRCHQRT